MEVSVLAVEIAQKVFGIRYRLRDRRWFSALTFCASAFLFCLRLHIDFTWFFFLLIGAPLVGRNFSSLSCWFLLPLYFLLQRGPQILISAGFHSHPTFLFSLESSLPLTPMPMRCLCGLSRLKWWFSSLDIRGFLCWLFLWDLELFATVILLETGYVLITSCIHGT